MKHIIFFLISVIIFFSTSSTACQVSSSGITYFDPSKVAQRHDVVFIGEVVSLVDSPDQKVKLKVIEVLKGKVLTETIKLTNLEGGCSSPLYKSQINKYNYLVMANGNDDTGYTTQGRFFALNKDSLTDVEVQKISEIKAITTPE